MKIVLVGYGEMLQALILGVLKTKHQIVGVLRHEKILYGPIKSKIYDYLKPSSDYTFLKNSKLYDIEATSVNSEQFRQELVKLKADLVLVGSWSEKFSVQTINIPKFGCINVHPSLLPKFRGPNPYMQAILHDEIQSGVTFHVMDVNYDTGAIVHQSPTLVFANDTGMSLKLRCCDLAMNEVEIFLNNFKEKMANPISQNEGEATYYPQLPLVDTILNFEKETSLEIDRRIRALTPWTKTYIPYKNKFFEFETYKLYNKIYTKDASQIVRVVGDSVFIVCADKKVIEFSGLKLKNPLGKILSNLYVNKYIKVNSKAI
ncbi:MAG: hypothetical protein E7Z90_03005 [Cyanobacteria bacterium SIG29]|nr:hypothetical protein [Cyanobacteria bacterium SIG29]